jgi:NAD-dependent dihydropyrimidine dehydrogenase PreA subunit
MKSEIPIHIVCTTEEAKQLVEAHKNFFVSNCGCREDNGKCKQSRMDVCLNFYEDTEASGSGKRSISKNEADEILKEALNKKLVPRPFRSDDRKQIDGVCFCCNDCCWYFRNREEPCDKGTFVEETNKAECAHCGLCVDVCYFKARERKDGVLFINRDECYGCGLCASECPNECIKMIKR